ncbi:MAG: DUF58 domain-containing protein [Polyangia bacterium]
MTPTGAGPSAPRVETLAAVELAKLSSLALRARTIVEGALSGMHRNLHPGASLEFTEHKEYAPGDEVRRIDWKAVARTDRYTVKRFEDETEMRLLLVFDSSASMGYRNTSLTKLEYATYLGAALAYLAGEQRDAAGVLAFDSEIRAFLPPSTRAGQMREVLLMLEGLRPSGSTDPRHALDAAAEACSKRSLLVMFSDLLDSEPGATGGSLAEQMRQLRARGHDVVLFHVLDPDEVSLPFAEMVHFEGMEPGDERTLLAEARDLVQAFAEESEAFRQRWRAISLDAQIEYRFVSTDMPPADVLRAFLADRQHPARQR